MGQKLKITGWVAAGAVAGILTTASLQTVARGSLAPLPLEELQQLAAVFGMVKSDYVEPVDEKKLISDAISGMVAGLDRAEIAQRLYISPNTVRTHAQHLLRVAEVHSTLALVARARELGVRGIDDEDASSR